MPGDELVERLALALPKPVIEVFRDSDGLVVVADFRQVTPEHGQIAVTAEAVPTQPDRFVGPAAGHDDRLPDVADSLVLRVVGVGESLQVRFVRGCTGNLVERH